MTTRCVGLHSAAALAHGDAPPPKITPCYLQEGLQTLAQSGEHMAQWVQGVLQVAAALCLLAAGYGCAQAHVHAANAADPLQTPYLIATVVMYVIGGTLLVVGGVEVLVRWPTLGQHRQRFMQVAAHLAQAEQQGMPMCQQDIHDGGIVARYRGFAQLRWWLGNKQSLQLELPNSEIQCIRLSNINPHEAGILYYRDTPHGRRYFLHYAAGFSPVAGTILGIFASLVINAADTGPVVHRD